MSDYSNMVELMQSYIGKPIQLREGSVLAKSQRTLTSVVNLNDTDLQVGYQVGSNEQETYKVLSTDKVHFEDFRFEGLSLEEIVQRDKLSGSLQRFSDAMYSYTPDVFLVSADGRKVSAHKCVLGARSPVFHAMFTTQMKENNLTEVNLKNNSPDALQTFVQLLYAKPCPGLQSHILEILELADIYQIGSLKLFVDESQMMSVFTSENIVKILFKAAQRRQMDVWRMAFRFILDNDVTVQKSEFWKDMKRKGTIMELDTDGFEEIIRKVKKSKK